MSRDAAYALDMLTVARRALRHLGGADYERFRNDDMMQDAVIRCLEVLGEAARHISAEYAAAHPEVPWRTTSRMRHRLAHDYDRIELSIVWDTVHVDLPDLITALEPLVPE